VAAAASSSYPLDPASAARARAWSRDYLDHALAAEPHRPNLISDAVVVVSELITNAIRAHSHHTVLTLLATDATVTVSVTDDVPSVPEWREPGPGEASGRGLHVVEAISTDWGVTTWGVGKTVWAELSVG
jgi:anti-sigma regulatory factor (Ser/Thr protein kinase)